MRICGGCLATPRIGGEKVSPLQLGSVRSTVVSIDAPKAPKSTIWQTTVAATAEPLFSHKRAHWAFRGSPSEMLSLFGSVDDQRRKNRHSERATSDPRRARCDCCGSRERARSAGCLAAAAAASRDRETDTSELTNKQAADTKCSQRLSVCLDADRQQQQMLAASQTKEWRTKRARRRREADSNRFIHLRLLIEQGGGPPMAPQASEVCFVVVR